MRLTSVLSILSIILFAHCSDSKSAVQQYADMAILSTTIQEHVSGVEGQGSTFHFNLEIVINAEGMTADSIYYKNSGAQLFNPEGRLYKGRVQVSPENRNVKDEFVRVRFKKGNEVQIITVDSVQVLEPVYMP